MAKKKSLGAQPGNANALKSGFYSRTFSEAELVEIGRRALAELGIEWKDVMALGVHSDRVVIIEGPVGYKRVYALPGAGELEE